MQNRERTFTYAVEALIKVLQANLEQHRAIFEEALAGWKRVVTERLARAFTDAQAGIRYRTHFTLVQPQDHSNDYRRWIKMLEMTTDPSVDLTEQEFSQYVMDDWRWKGEFLRAASTYSRSAAKALEEYDG
ncbi:MAG: hypothetical protein ACE5F1_01005 [Planctomycetota bacterium]